NLTQRYLIITATALVLDGALSAIEAWALHRRKMWGEWLVVLASASLMPFEIWRVVRRPRIGGFILLGINVVVVVYLARRIRWQRSHQPARAGAARAL